MVLSNVSRVIQLEVQKLRCEAMVLACCKEMNVSFGNFNFSNEMFCSSEDLKHMLAVSSGYILSN